MSTNNATTIIPETTTALQDAPTTAVTTTRKKAANNKKPAEKKVPTKRAPRTKKATAAADTSASTISAGGSDNTSADTSDSTAADTTASTTADTSADTSDSTTADTAANEEVSTSRASVKVTTYCGNEFYFRPNDTIAVEAYDPVTGMDVSRKVSAMELQVNWRIPCEWREEIQLDQSSETAAGNVDLIQKTIEIMTHPKASAQLIRTGDACWVKCRLPCKDINLLECNDDHKSDQNRSRLDENHIREIVWRWRAIGGNVCIAKNKLVRRVFVRCNVRGPHMSEAVSDVVDIIFKANVLNYITRSEHAHKLPNTWLSSLETNIDEWKEHYAIKSIDVSDVDAGVYCNAGSVVESQRANGWYYNIKLVM